MSDSTPGLPPAGWYPDPAGGPTRRWWDGVRWTERIEAPTGTVDPVLPSPIPEATPGTSPNTWAFWVVALLPLLSIVSVSVWDIEGYFRRTFADFSVSQNPGANVNLNIYALTGPTFLISQLLGLLVLVAFIVFSALDYRILKSRGIDRPFHWAWSFFTLITGGQLVYLIGRTVVARRRTGRSASLPMWISIALGVVLLIVTLVKIFAAFAAIIPELQQYGTSQNG